MNKHILTIVLIAAGFAGRVHAEDIPTLPPDLNAFAETCFESVSLTPQIHLSASLVQQGATAELKGKDLDEIKALYAKKDWTGLINLLNKDHLPSARTVNENLVTDSLHKLLAKDFQVFVKTSYKRSPHTALIYFTFAVNSDPMNEVFMQNKSLPKDVLAHWEKAALMADREGHRIPPIMGRLGEVAPDGDGYFYTWQPRNGQVFVVLGQSEVETKYTSFNDEFSNKQHALESRVKLGELTDQQCAAALHDLLLSIQKETTVWAESVSLK